MPVATMQQRRLTGCNEKKQAAFRLANVEIDRAFDSEATLFLAELNSFNFPCGTPFYVCVFMWNTTSVLILFLFLNMPADMSPLFISKGENPGGQKQACGGKKTFVEFR